MQKYHFQLCFMESNHMMHITILVHFCFERARRALHSVHDCCVQTDGVASEIHGRSIKSHFPKDMFWFHATERTDIESEQKSLIEFQFCVASHLQRRFRFCWTRQHFFFGRINNNFPAGLFRDRNRQWTRRSAHKLCLF